MHGLRPAGQQNVTDMREVDELVLGEFGNKFEPKVPVGIFSLALRVVSEVGTVAECHAQSVVRPIQFARDGWFPTSSLQQTQHVEIGSAYCWERVCQYV